MPQKLLDVLTLGHCSHEFSWPRRAPDGHYYQVCMLCATEYLYDWTTMRRTSRVEHKATEGSAASPSGEPARPSWVPRARRLKWAVPLRYRAKATAVWIAGTTANLSQSGVLFVGKQSLSQGSLVELMFEMPEEISGQKQAKVFCQGQVVRCRPRKLRDSGKEEASELAACVLDYRFLSRD
jgi:PilZ domain